MEALAIQVLSLSQGASTLLSWLVLTLSAAATVWLSNVGWKLRRTQYVVALCAVFFLYCATNVLALWFAEAVRSGHLALFVATAYALLIPIGAVAGLVSAARALDAYGTRNWWFFGFLPVTNFLLLGVPSRNRAPLRASGVLARIVLLAVGLSLLSFGARIEWAVGKSVREADCLPDEVASDGHDI